MKFIDSFEGWWRDVGQFIPPCDVLTGFDRAVFKQFAHEVRKTCGDKSEELIDAENELKKCESVLLENKSQIDKLTESVLLNQSKIFGIISSNSTSSFDKINQLKKLYENKT